MKLLFGIDGGGTGTRLVASRLDGFVLGSWAFGGASLSRRSPEQVGAVLDQALRTAFEALSAQPVDVTAVCAGFASAALPERRAAYQDLIASRLPNARVLVLTDAELAFRGATAGRDGVLVIAGTGSIAWGQFAGRQVRVGGDRPGHDPGSADWIGRRAVSAALLPEPAGGDYASVLPRLVLDHAPAAVAVLTAAADQLVQLAIECARRLDWPDPVAYTWGGVFEHAPVVQSHFNRTWPHALGRPHSTPTQEALHLARQLLD